MSNALTTDNVLPLIQTIRGVRVILASDLAKLYGVAAKRLTEAVKRHKVRFRPPMSLTAARRWR